MRIPMIKVSRYRPYCILFMLLLSAVAVWAQQQTTARHSIYIISNQNKYTPGDTIFLKTYFVDDQMKGVVGKHLMSVHFINERGAPVLQTKFNVLAGIGYNQLILPDSIPVGFYNITGYMSPVEDGLNGYTTSTTVSVVQENQIFPNASSGQSAAGTWDSARARVQINVASNSLLRRQSASVEIQVLNGDGKPVKGEFSVRVYNKTVLDVPPAESAGEEPSTESIGESVDLSTPSAIAAFNVFQKTGKVFDAATGEPVADNTQVLFYLQNAQWYHQTFTMDGMVRLNLPQFNGSDELFYLAETPRGKIIHIKIEWLPTPLPRFRPAPSHTVTKAADPYALFMKDARRIQRSYQAFSAPDSVASTDELLEFDLTEPDNVYYPDRYIAFKSMAEMILEVIPGLYHRKHGESDNVRLNIADPITATTNPVYMIDGKATVDTRYFLSITPADVEYIAIIKDPKKLLPLRLLGKNGIVIVKTKSGKFAPRNDDKSKVVEGLTPPLAFHTGSVKVSAKIPVYRSTLYWNPSISTDKDGRTSITFQTTDDVGEMIVEVQGITSHGEPFRSTLPITVR